MTLKEPMKTRQSVYKYLHIDKLFHSFPDGQLRKHFELINKSIIHILIIVANLSQKSNILNIHESIFMNDVV